MRKPHRLLVEGRVADSSDLARLCKAEGVREVLDCKAAARERCLADETSAGSSWLRSISPGFADHERRCCPSSRCRASRRRRRHRPRECVCRRSTTRRATRPGPGETTSLAASSGLIPAGSPMASATIGVAIFSSRRLHGTATFQGVAERSLSPSVENSRTTMASQPSQTSSPGESRGRRVVRP